MIQQSWFAMSETNEWYTPQWLFDELDAEFHFTLDPCCTHESAKCEKHYTAEENGLIQDWQGETVFMNPPYGREIGKWIRKAYHEWKLGNCTIVCLIPARTDTSYWQKYILKYEKNIIKAVIADDVRFLSGRLYFTRKDGKSGPATFPSAIVIYRRQA